MMNQESQHTILLFYKYVRIDEPEILLKSQRELGEKFNLTGRIIVAKEGINATVEGLTENTDAYVKALTADARFSDIQFKKSQGTGDAFPKLSIKVRPEIVSAQLDDEDLNPAEFTAPRVKANELQEWLKSGEVIVVDMRNDYEFKVGHFVGSVFPDLKNFRDLKTNLNKITDLKDKKIVTVCTGGVRCEKASGYLLKKGFKDVYQLDGGIVSYLEKYPGQAFQGALYVFDNRLTMTFDDPAKHVVLTNCELCGIPSEWYVNCRYPKCNKHFIACQSCAPEIRSAYCRESCRESAEAELALSR